MTDRAKLKGLTKAGKRRGRRPAYLPEDEAGIPVVDIPERQEKPRQFGLQPELGLSAPPIEFVDPVAGEEGYPVLYRDDDATAEVSPIWPKAVASDEFTATFNEIVEVVMFKHRKKYETVVAIRKREAGLIATDDARAVAREAKRLQRLRARYAKAEGIDRIRRKDISPKD